MTPVTIEVPLWAAVAVVVLLAAALACGTNGQRIGVLAATAGALLQLPLFVGLGVVLALASRPDNREKE